MSAQALVAQDVPEPRAAARFTLATSKGVIYALAENSYVRWRVELGQLERVCQQIDGYRRDRHAGDSTRQGMRCTWPMRSGRIHALDLATGAERPRRGRSRSYTDFRRESWSGGR